MGAVPRPVRVALLITCFNDTLFPHVGRAVVELLERLGCEVAFPEEQTCCGQMHGNTGYRDQALDLARRTARVFAGEELIVCPSASCAGWLRELAPRLAADAGHEPLRAELAALGSRLRELTELVVDDLCAEDVGASFPHRVTYHPTCHSLRALGVGDRPRRLLGAVHGIDLVDLPAGEECCGFGGTFALKNADTSMAMLSDKVGHVLSTGAEVCASADTSCLMHIGGALRRQRTGVRTMHLAEILAARE
ncbi:MAG: (Fe-S)-binding protein [Thermoleophilia bacterium]